MHRLSIDSTDADDVPGMSLEHSLDWSLREFHVLPSLTRSMCVYCGADKDSLPSLANVSSEAQQQTNSLMQLVYGQVLPNC